MVSGERREFVATDLGSPERGREAEEPVAARLKKRYGADVDPGISLQERATGDELEPVAGPSSQILRRLEAHGLKQTRYRLKGEIARGGMGAILKVWDEDLRRNLAMKVVLGDGEQEEGAEVADIDPLTLGRFLEEAQVTGQLDHPGIVPVHELGLDDAGHVYFTMRLVKGRDLRTIFDLVREGEEGWSVTRALGVLLRVCEAMSYAHAKGVIHRDLKPSNVMVGRFGEVYVMDWGLARVVGQEDRHEQRLRMDLATGTVDTDREREAESASDDALRTMDGTVVGTPVYMSPEQARGLTDELDARADVYAVGAMLYDLLAGQMPYVPSGARIPPRLILFKLLHDPPKPLHELAPQVPAELVAICEKAMSRERSQRYADMSELAEDLRAYLEHRVVRAYRTGAVTELRKWVERNKPLAAALAAGVLVLVAGLAAALVLRQRAEDERRATERALRTTRALALASAAGEVVESNTMAALLLAREAVGVEQTPETLSRLHQAVGAVRERALFRQTAPFFGAVFSPAGDKLLGVTRTALLWDLEVSDPAAEPVRLAGHTASVDAGCFSPSGKLVLTCSMDRTARLWDLQGRELARFTHDGRVLRATFSPDERLVLTTSVDGTAKLWRRDEDSEPLAVLGGQVRCASFSPDGRHLVTASTDGLGRLWRFHSQQGTVELLHELVGHEGEVRGAEFSPDGDQILTRSLLDGVRVWNLQGEELARFEGDTGGVVWAGFSPSGDRILTSSHVGQLWDLDGSLLATFGRPPLSKGAFSPDGRLVGFAGDRGTSWLFDLAGNEIGSLGGHDREVWGLHFSPDSRSVVTPSLDGTIRLWNVRDEVLPAFYAHRGTVWSAIYSRDGATIATAAARGAPRLWDPKGNELAVLSGTSASSVEYSPDGHRLLTASRGSRKAQLWDLEGNELQAFEHPPEVRAVRHASFSTYGESIATACLNGSVFVWDLDGNELRRFETNRNLWHVEFSPDDERLLTGGSYGRVVLLERADGSMRELPYVGRHPTFSPDGDRVLVPCDDGRVVLSSLMGEVLQEFHGHEAQVMRASFSPDGQRIVTASRDGTARIWRLDGTLEATLRGHTGTVHSAVFSPSGDRVLTSSSDGRVRTWLVETDELRRLADQRITRDFLPDELLRYEDLLDVPASEARELVERLYDELVFKELVIDRLREDRGVGEELTGISLRFAEGLADRAPTEGSDQAWYIVIQPHDSEEAYAHALRLAEVACEREPDQHFMLNVLGVAQYRTGRFDEALETLERADQLNTRAAQPYNRAFDLLFEAMAYARLDDTEEAQHLLDEARALVLPEKNPVWEKELDGFLREAEELIEGAGAP